MTFMTGVLAEAGTLDMTELERSLVEHPVCDFRLCSAAATWIGTARPCGCSLLVCDAHHQQWTGAVASLRVKVCELHHPRTSVERVDWRPL